MTGPVLRRADERLAQRVEIGRGEDRHDTGRLFRGVEIDGANARMRMRAAHEVQVQHARDFDVVEIAATAAQEPLELEPRNARADAGMFRCHYDLSAGVLAAITAETASTIA